MSNIQKAETALARDADFNPSQPETLAQAGTLAQTFFRSGFFSDVKSASQAVVKIIAGRELGIPPMAAMREVHVFKGKVELSYTIMGSLLRQHERYDYRVTENSNEAAEVVITRDGQDVGASRFTMEDAKRARLAGKDNWRNYPRAMCLARAMSEAVRTHAPDVSHGAIYAHGEISDSEPLQADPFEISDEPSPAPIPEPQEDEEPGGDTPEEPDYERLAVRFATGVHARSKQCQLLEPNGKHDTKLAAAKVHVEDWPEEHKTEARHELAKALAHERKKRQMIAECIRNVQSVGYDEEAWREGVADSNDGAAPEELPVEDLEQILDVSREAAEKSRKQRDEPTFSEPALK